MAEIQAKRQTQGILQMLPPNLVRYGPVTVGLVLLVSYVLVNLYWPTALTNLGLPKWQDLGEQWRLAVILNGVLFVAIVIYSLQSAIRGLETTKRIAALIVLVIVLPVVAYSAFQVLDSDWRLHVSRLLLIVVFTALPASFYYLFITSKRETMWEELKLNFQILDPKTNDERINIFRKKFEALYGRSVTTVMTPSAAAGRLTRETPFPVFFLTLIVGLGWLFFFSPDQAPDQALTFEQGLVSPFTFGFLGAYFFSVQMLFRRYVQSDLKPRAYAHASQRIIITLVFALVLPYLLPFAAESDGAGTQPDYTLPAIAFLIGVFPAIAFQILGQLGSKTLGIALDSFKQTHPLSKIDGITIWVEARLLEEDIENVQNLVSTDIDHLMLNTHLQPQRIIDWIDQGVLLLHLSEVLDKALTDALKNRGITTATDLIFGHQLDVLGLPPAQATLATAMVVAMRNDPNMYHVEAWRKAHEMTTGTTTAAAPAPSI